MTPKSSAQLDAEITKALGRKDHSARKLIPAAVKKEIERRALEIIQKAYSRFETVGGKEPCLTVGLITDDLRQQSGLPEDFRFATKTRQRTWTRSVLKSMRRKNRIGSSFGEASRCYEPKQ